MTYLIQISFSCCHWNVHHNQQLKAAWCLYDSVHCIIFELRSFQRNRFVSLLSSSLQLIWCLGLQSYRRIGVHANCANWRTQCHSIEISNKQQNQNQSNSSRCCCCCCVFKKIYYYCIFNSPLEYHISFTNTQSIITS